MKSVTNERIFNHLAKNGIQDSLYVLDREIDQDHISSEIVDSCKNSDVVVLSLGRFTGKGRNNQTVQGNLSSLVQSLLLLNKKVVFVAPQKQREFYTHHLEKLDGAHFKFIEFTGDYQNEADIIKFYEGICAKIGISTEINQDTRARPYFKCGHLNCTPSKKY